MYKFLTNFLVLGTLTSLIFIGACKEKLPVDDGGELVNLDATTIQLESDLTAYWTFNDNTAKDITGNGFDGTFMSNFNTSAEGVLSADGLKGYGVNFNGVDNWIDINDNGKLLETGKATTITAWVKNKTNGFAAVLAKWDADKYPNGSDWWFGLYDGEIHFTSNGDGCGKYCQDKMSSGANIPNDEWTMVGVIVTNTEVYYIKNGKIIDTEKGNFRFSNSSAHIRFGKQNDDAIGNESWYNGNLDEVRVYKRALNRNELYKIYTMHKPPKDSFPPLVVIPDLLARWSFDDNTATDLTGNGYNGVKNNDFQSSEGVRSKAMNFYRDGSWIDVGERQLLIPDKDMTITMWVNPTTVNDFRAILTKWEVENKPYGLDWWFGIYNGEIHFTNNARGCGTYCPDKMSNGLMIPTNQWTMIGVVITKNTVYYVKNGKIIDQDNGNYTFASSASKIRFGRQNGIILGNESWYRGGLDEACIYNRALTESELMSIYTSKQ